MAELPQAYFPEMLRLEGIGKEEFSNYGNYGSVLITGNGKPEMVFQYNHHGHEHNLQLSAVAPSLPLSESPVMVDSISEDRVMQRVRAQRKAGMALLKKLSRFRGLLKTEKCCFLKESVQVLQEWLEEHYTEELPEGSAYPEWFSSADDLVQQLPPSGCVPKVNASFYGGCVSAFKTSGRVGIIHASGTDFDQLSVATVSASPEEEGGERILRQASGTTTSVGSPVYQVQTAVVRQNVTACVRTAEECRMYGVTWDEDADSFQSKLLDVQAVKGEKVTSVSVSPYIPEESLMVSDVGSVYLWNAGKSFRQIVDREELRFSCLETWRHCHYGAHPRQVVLTDRTSMQLFDSRSPFRGGGLDLFALPSCLVKPYERIAASEHHGAWPHCHLVATDHWLLIIDQRFPQHPVLQWNHMLQGPPQYLSTVDYSPGSSVALVGCQDQPEVTAFHFQHGAGMPVSSEFQPWRISPFWEFGQMAGVESGASWLLQHRLKTSLAGLAACQGLQEGTLAAFQMDSFGEVYHQVYGPRTAGSADKTGRRGNSLVWKERAVRWLETLGQQIRDLQSERVQPLQYSVPALQNFTVPHHLCKNAMECVLCWKWKENSGQEEEREEDMDTSFDLLQALTEPTVCEDAEDDGDGPPVCRDCHARTVREDPAERSFLKAASLHLPAATEEDEKLEEQLLDVEEYFVSPEGQEDISSQILALEYQGDERYQHFIQQRAEEMERQKNEYIQAVWREHMERTAAEGAGTSAERRSADREMNRKTVKNGERSTSDDTERTSDRDRGSDNNTERTCERDGGSDDDAERASDGERDSDVGTQRGSDGDRQTDIDRERESDRLSLISSDIDMLVGRLLRT